MNGTAAVMCVGCREGKGGEGRGGGGGSGHCFARRQVNYCRGTRAMLTATTLQMKNGGIKDAGEAGEIYFLIRKMTIRMKM